ncbi:PAS domain-containing sensor histidine kinase [bacterium]|nr:PAS domain-containing sensor histidine kinase [bacterium]
MKDFYERLFNEIPCFVTTQNREFKIIAANSMFRREFGREADSYCFEVYKGRVEKCPDCPLELTFKDGQCHRSEEIVKLKDGRELCVLVYTAPLRNDKGEIIAAIEVSADITEVKKLHQKYRTLFDVAPGYISVHDRDLKLSDTNKRFQADFGEGIGKSCFEIYKHRTEPCLDCAVAKTFQDGQIHQSEEIVTSKDGLQKNVICYTAPVHNPLGGIDSVMEMSADITDLRQVQSRLTSLGMLVGSISHDIKGLLSGLDGGVYLMQTGFKKNNEDRVKQGLEMVERNVDRIRSMVLNVLYYAKDRYVIWEPINVEKLASSVVEILTDRAKQFNVKIEVNTAVGSFEGDLDAVRSLLLNLIENSLDACHTDNRKLSQKVELKARFDNNDVIFEISDNGIGMDQETREKAFSLFFSSKGSGGTGLGLFIAQKIVASHNGTIEIESTPGKGSCFTVKLPRKKPLDFMEFSDTVEKSLDDLL